QETGADPAGGRARLQVARTRAPAADPGRARRTMARLSRQHATRRSCRRRPPRGDLRARPRTLSTLVDTNVLLRQFEPAHDHHGAAIAATMWLIESGETLQVAAQSIAEFWAVATRPVGQNGLGLDVALASSAIAEIERTFELLLSDEAMVYPYWKRLVAEQRVTGRRVFDARLVAVMLAHRIDRLLTFNAADFAGLGVPVL